VPGRRPNAMTNMCTAARAGLRCIVYFLAALAGSRPDWPSGCPPVRFPGRSRPPPGLCTYRSDNKWLLRPEAKYRHAREHRRTSDPGHTVHERPLASIDLALCQWAILGSNQ
jgi:hypothetical protein